MIDSAYYHFLLADYVESARLYEAAINADPAFLKHYWYLGLTYLLQGQEEAAQVAWLAGLSQLETGEEDPDMDLFQVLLTEAERLERLQSYQFAWLLRSHAHELYPEHLNNALKIVWLCLDELQNFYPEQLVELALPERLQSVTLSPDDQHLLLRIGERLQQTIGHHPIVADFLQTYVPHLLPSQTVPEPADPLPEETVAELKFQRHSWPGTLFNLRHLGFAPATVIDVGAGTGTFDLYHVFPDANHLLIEPRPQDAPHLEKLCTLFPHAQYVTAGASREVGALDMEVPGPNGESSVVSVPLIPLDQLCAERHLPGPYLLKVDVDGAEIDVLSGAERILAETEYLIIETTLFNQFYDVLDFMRQRDFVVYDIVNPVYRLADAALWQVDTAFVKKSGPFRRNLDFYADQAQKERLESDLKQQHEFMIHYLNELFLPELNRIQRTMQAGKIRIVCS